MLATRKALLTAIVSTIAFGLCAQIGAVAPSPEARAKWEAEGVWEQKVDNWNEFKRQGGCAAEAHSAFRGGKNSDNLASASGAVDSVNLMVILVDFSDWEWDGQAAQVTPADFTTHLFSNRDVDAVFNPTGSMTDYYLENSYDNFYVKGVVYGWYRMPLTYEYYVGLDDGLSKGKALAKTALDSALAHVPNLTIHDMNDDEWLDGLVVIHAGRGAEEPGVNGIWSHKSNVVPEETPIIVDGVKISAYTMNPEESGNEISQIGVFCHEYAHFLGLPDLYDIDYDPPESAGLGRWGLMATGSWLGGGTYPAHLNAWCKAEVGFLSLISVSENIVNAPIPQIVDEPIAYFFKKQSGDRQFWIVENRQKVGFDRLLPGSGLCIYHIDLDAIPQNNDPNRYFVALEQADGKDDLGFTLNNNGDAGDAWPGATKNRNFHALSIPSSAYNNGLVTQIGVWNISDSDSAMFADLDINYSRPYPLLAGETPLLFDDDHEGGDRDGFMEAGETINFYVTINNPMRTAYNPRASMTCSNSAVVFLTNDVSLGSTLGFGPVSNYTTLEPITFTIADSLAPIIDSMFLTITADSIPGEPGGPNYTKVFPLEVSLGAPQIVIVDDNQTGNWGGTLRDMIYTRRLPHHVWKSASQGSPTGAELGIYPMVFWHTGADSATGSVTQPDIDAMKEYLNTYEGNLFLTGFSAVRNINDLDPAFLADYLHLTVESTTRAGSKFIGRDDNPLTAGTQYLFRSDVGNKERAVVTPLGNAQVAFETSGQTDVFAGISYEGAHKSIVLCFPFEYIRDNKLGYTSKDTLLNRIMDFFGGIQLGVNDGSPFSTLPMNFDLYPNYPNPFNPSTLISYTLRAAEFDGRPARTTMTLYNALGQQVKTLVDKVQLPGNYTVEWDGRSTAGEKVASGIYFYRLVRGDNSVARKMILLK